MPTSSQDPSSRDHPVQQGAEGKQRQLDGVRVDPADTSLTTNQGVRVDHTDDSLTVGERGPTLLENFHAPGEDHPLRSRADAGASGARPRLGRLRALPALRLLAGRLHHRAVPDRPDGGDATVRPVLHSRGLPRFRRHGARRARLRHQVLHEAGQLRPRRQQHAGVLHPRRHQVPRLRARGEAGAQQRDPAGPVHTRHLLGLCVAATRGAAHGDVADVGPRDRAATA